MRRPDLIDVQGIDARQEYESDGFPGVFSIVGLLCRWQRRRIHRWEMIDTNVTFFEKQLLLACFSWDERYGINPNKPSLRSSRKCRHQEWWSHILHEIQTFSCSDLYVCVHNACLSCFLLTTFMFLCSRRIGDEITSSEFEIIYFRYIQHLRLFLFQVDRVIEITCISWHCYLFLWLRMRRKLMGNQSKREKFSFSRRLVQSTVPVEQNPD